MSFSITSHGDLAKTMRFLKNAMSTPFLSGLEKFGQQGVNALASATPKLTGDAAHSWYYKVYRTPTFTSIVWYNDSMVETVPLVILLQYGHGTRNGGYVQGRDFINPAIRPVFDDIAKAAWGKLKNM